MKIGFVCSEYPPGAHGGIGTMTQELARALVARGHQVRVIGLYHGLPAPTMDDDLGVKVFRLPLSQMRGGWLIGRWQLFRAVRQWAQNGEIDLIEVPDWEGMAAYWPRLNVPVVARLHGSSTLLDAELGQPTPRRRHTLDRASLRRADFRASVSRYTAQRTRALFQLSSGTEPILHNFISPPTPGDMPRSADTVVFTGTLTRNKGVIQLLKAWPLVIERFPAARLHLYGKDTMYNGGSMRTYLLSHLGAPHTVTFHGHVPREELMAVLQVARAAVFPSSFESFAHAPLEAMAAGCPTIYTRRGSGPELIDHDLDGLLIDPKRPEQIADAICALLGDDALAHRLGAAGRSKVQTCFLPGSLVPQNEQFYAQCIERFHARL